LAGPEHAIEAVAQLFDLEDLLAARLFCEAAAVEAVAGAEGSRPRATE
jgi:hypothetical protein